MLSANERRRRVGEQRTVVSNVCVGDEEVSHSTRGLQPLLPSSSLEGERGGELGLSSPTDDDGASRMCQNITETGGALTRVEEVAGALLCLACDRGENPAHGRMSCVCASCPMQFVVAGEARESQRADFQRGELMQRSPTRAVSQVFRSLSPIYRSFSLRASLMSSRDAASYACARKEATHAMSAV